MSVSIEDLRPYLQSFDLTRLLVEGLGWNHYTAEPLTVLVEGCEYSLKPLAEGLGWNHYTAEPLTVLVEGCEYSLKPLAEKAGFQVFECSPAQDGGVPLYPVRRKVENQVAKSAFEHMLIFVDGARTTQIWQWVKRETGKPQACQRTDVL